MDRCPNTRRLRDQRPLINDGNDGSKKTDVDEQLTNGPMPEYPQAPGSKVTDQ